MKKLCFAEPLHRFASEIAKFQATSSLFMKESVIFNRNVLKKLCFAEPLHRFASEIAKFQATSSLFMKESVIFNCLSIKNNKTWYFFIHLPLIYFKTILPNTFLITTLFQKKKQIEGFRTWNLKGFWKK